MSSTCRSRTHARRRGSVHFSCCAFARIRVRTVVFVFLAAVRHLLPDGQGSHCVIDFLLRFLSVMVPPQFCRNLASARELAHRVSRHVTHRNAVGRGWPGRSVHASLGVWCCACPQTQRARECSAVARGHGMTTNLSSPPAWMYVDQVVRAGCRVAHVQHVTVFEVVAGLAVIGRIQLWA